MLSVSQRWGLPHDGTRQVRGMCVHDSEVKNEEIVEGQDPAERYLKVNKAGKSL